MQIRTNINLFVVTLLSLSAINISFGQNSVDESIKYLDEHLYDNLDSSLTIANKALTEADEGSQEYTTILSRKAVVLDIKGNTEACFRKLS